MSGPSGTWQQTGGGGLDLGTVVTLGALAAAAGTAFAVVQAVAAIPVYAWVLAAMTTTASVVLAVRRQRRHVAVITAALTARRAEMAAAEDREALARHQRRLERARAAAPVIENHVHLPAADELAAALLRQRTQYAPATVITDAQEIKR